MSIKTKRKTESFGAEIIRSVNMSASGKVGNYSARKDGGGRQLVYELPSVTDEPSQKQVDVRERFKICSQRVAELNRADVTSWKNRLANKSNTYQGEFVQVVQKAYYEENSSFNLIRGVKVLASKPERANFVFTFDLPGDFIILHRKKFEMSWSSENFTLNQVAAAEGRFSLFGLRADTEYMVRVVQPKTLVETREEQKLGTVGSQPVPTHIKGESGDYYFKTPAFSWKRISGDS